MVFKPFSHLARRSSKAFTHGYAQSLAAASQSSYASSQTPLGHFNHYRFGKAVSLQQRENYHQNALQQTPPSKPTLTGVAEAGHDATLDAYLAAWQKHYSGDEWQPFVAGKQSTQRQKPGFSPRLFEKDDRSAKVSQAATPTPAIERAHSASALDDIRKAEDGKEAVALEEVNEAISREIESIQTETLRSIPGGTPDSFTPLKPESTSLESVAKDDRITRPTSSEDAEWTTFVEQISIFEKSGRYAEIPAIFEAMFRRGLTPPTRAYNSLVVAAVRLSSSTAQVIPKVLDVYSNMRHRNIAPDGFTYTLLLELLSVRALEVSGSRDSLQLNRRRFPGSSNGSGFMFRSRETELDIVGEDDSLNVALKLFDHATRHLSHFVFPAATYRYLLEACATTGEIEQMIRIYSHMESQKVVPSAALYPPMIRAFAMSGDLQSAVECYNGYKSLAIADNSGALALRSRADEDVYSALVRSYLVCDRPTGAEQFMEKVTKSLESTGLSELTRQTQDSIMLDGFVEQYLTTGQFEDALSMCNGNLLSATSRQRALARIAGAAADIDRREIAERAYWDVLQGKGTVASAISMLAMYLRKDDLPLARKVWTFLSSVQDPGIESIEPTVAYSVALIRAGCADEGLVQARLAFERARASSSIKDAQQLSELIDEGIEYIAQSLAPEGVIPSAEASMEFMWAMVENGGLLTPVAEQLLASLGPDDVTRLSWANLKLALQVEGGIVSTERASSDIAHSSRFGHILETVIHSRMPVDKRTMGIVKATLPTLETQRPDLAALWQDYTRPSNFSDSLPLHAQDHARSLAPIRSATFRDGLDPYANTLDQRGSAAIVDELEKQGVASAACLHEALARLRNIRRAGRHPRYIAYAKLIAAAAREGRTNLVQELYGLAQRDMPLLMEYPVVRHGWTTVFDAMIGAFLTLGNRSMAAEYHQKLLEIGSSPSANTFGLYITTLKESTKTFDEATEAVKIFLRAKSEGVEPSSFLYNALIGKLGKARRIDDCLFYFAEMRSRGVRPTSVTYGTIVNALCRVSDERFAEELFDEMESMPNYKPRPAPYNSMMQFFLTTKRDSSKVLEYYRRMQSRNIKPTMHTYKLLIDTYATLEPVNLAAAQSVFDAIRASGQKPENIHFASLIHAKGCVLHDMEGARSIFNEVVANSSTKPHACLYQALAESMVANHSVKDTDFLLQDMRDRQVEITAYIANTLIHGWAMEKDIVRATAVYNSVGLDKREPSTYEAMTRAFLAVEDRESASGIVQEMLSRGYPSAVSSKILELLGHGSPYQNGSTQDSSLSENVV